MADPNPTMGNMAYPQSASPYAFPTPPQVPATTPQQLLGQTYAARVQQQEMINLQQQRLRQEQAP